MKLRREPTTTSIKTNERIKAISIRADVTFSLGLLLLLELEQFIILDILQTLEKHDTLYENKKSTMLLGTLCVIFDERKSNVKLVCPLNNRVDCLKVGNDGVCLAVIAWFCKK